MTIAAMSAMIHQLRQDRSQDHTRTSAVDRSASVASVRQTWSMSASSCGGIVLSNTNGAYQTI